MYICVLFLLFGCGFVFRLFVLGVLVFHYVGVVAFALTMRTL